MPFSYYACSLRWQSCSCKVGREEYYRPSIRNETALSENRKSCGGDSSLHPQDLTLQGYGIDIVPLHDKETASGALREPLFTKKFGLHRSAV